MVCSCPFCVKGEEHGNTKNDEQSKRSHKKSHICNTQQYINEDIYQSHE